MFGKGLLKEYFCKIFVKISTVRFNFNFSHYKSMEILSCHSDESAQAMATKNRLFVEPYIMNIF